MSVRLSERKKLLESAAGAFKAHVLTVDVLDNRMRPVAWRCGVPDSRIYSFHVAELPGCIAQWGDVGGLLIEQGRGYDVEWLMGAVGRGGHIDYMLGKVKAEKTRFVPELFQEYLADHGDPKVMHRLFGGKRRSLEYAHEDYVEYAQCSGDTEIGEYCFEYSLDVLWGAAALVKFVELLRKERENADVRAG